MLKLNYCIFDRYVCGPEACHRLFGFNIYHWSTSVERLSFHLPNHNFVTFKESDDLRNVCDSAKIKNNKLEAFFKLCQYDPDVRKYTYQDIPRYYVWNSGNCMWTRRKRGTMMGRMYN